MTTANDQWEQLRRQYMDRIAKALGTASGSERKQILDDVAVHLDRRFAELTAEEQTWENMQQIITEMGPVEDYAELLEEKPEPKKHKKSSLAYWIFGLIFLLVVLSFAPTCWKGYKESQKPPKRPSVINSFPWPLATDVDPDTAEIRVTFDQPMMNFSWSWVGGGEHFPELTGDPRYDNQRRTCTLPVKLKPGHWYWVGINSEKFVNFQTEKHVPARPYVIIFATADENGNPTRIPDEYIDEAKRINAQGKDDEALPETNASTAGYLLHFTPIGDFTPVTPRELLKEFNLNHPQNVSTWYFRTEPKDGRLQGSIFTPTQREADLLEKMIHENPKLRLLRTEQVTTAALEVHKERKQLSLPGQ
jgi:hypothetical protein